MDIEDTLPPDRLAAVLDRVAQHWTRLGETRPHWSVRAEDAYLPDRIDANRAAFDASGERDAQMLLDTLARHGRRPDQFTVAYDFGCGVGRVALPLARRFARVVACDVSAAHLALARAEAGRHRVANLRFARVTPPTLGMAEPFDLWWSHLTLQHSPAPVVAAILARMFSLLRPGGMAVFQVPTWLDGYRFNAAAYLSAVRSPGAIEIHPTPQATVFRHAHAAGCVPLSVIADASVWPPASVRSDVFVFHRP